jgi:prepilin-type N-terminal cleavage/methylation domain-containing protein
VPRSLDDEKGLTLVEMMVAMLIVGVVMMAMASVALASMRSVQTSERVVRATQLGNEVLETYLALPYDDLGMYTTDATDEWGGVTFEGNDLVLFPDPLGAPDPRVPLASATVVRDGISYQVRTAVVWVDDVETDAAQDYKRVVVELAWDVRGEARSARVEALRTPGPADQPLTVTVIPDVIPIDDNGRQLQDFVIEVIATEPQTAVTVAWEGREGVAESEGSYSLTSSDKLVWTKTVTGHYFSNGGTLFTVEGTAAGGAQKEVTTIGRALFLHSLAIPPGRTGWAALDYEPPRTNLTYHPDTGICAPELRIESVAVGAIFSDPMSILIAGSTYPMEATEPALVDGTRFRIDLETAELGVTSAPTSVPATLTITRPTGIEDQTRSLDISVPVEHVGWTVDLETGEAVLNACP